MSLSLKIKRFTSWAFLCVFAVTLLMNFIPVQRTQALTDAGKNRIIASGLAVCLYHLTSIDEEDGDITGDITDYWDEEGNRETAAVGIGLDPENGMWSCNQIVDALGPIASSLGLSGSSTEELRDSLEIAIIGNTIEDQGSNGINGGDFENAAKDFVRNVLQPYITSLPLSDQDLADRLLPLYEYCFNYKVAPNFSNPTNHNFDQTIGGQQVWFDFKRPSGEEITTDLGMLRNGGVFGGGLGSTTDVEIAKDIETGFKYSEIENEIPYTWNFYPVGNDFLLTQTNFDLSDNDKDYYETDALGSCEFAEDNASTVAQFYGLNADGVLTFNGQTTQQIRDGAPEDSNLNLANGDDRPTCEGADALGWVMCPIIAGILALNDAIFRTFIEPFLRVDPINTNSGPIYAIWSSFRTVGNIMLVFGLLFIVFGQSLGGGLVDAYTAKKAMPRIFVAAVLINLSIYIVAFMIDIGNILGAGIGQVITAPLYASGLATYNIESVAGTIVLVGLMLGLGLAVVLGLALKRGVNDARNNVAGARSALIYAVIFFGVPALLLIIAIFATLIIRLGAILLLTVASPVALALFVMPATDKYAKKWFDFLVKTILVYPIVVAIFALADVLSILLSSSVEGSDFNFYELVLTIASGGTYTIASVISGNGLPVVDIDFRSILVSLISVVILFVPLAMIPFSFKLAGGIMGSLLNAVTKVRARGDTLIRGDKHELDGRYRNMKEKINKNFEGPRTAALTDMKEGLLHPSRRVQSWGARRRVKKGTATPLPPPSGSSSPVSTAGASASELLARADDGARSADRPSSVTLGESEDVLGYGSSSTTTSSGTGGRRSGTTSSSPRVVTIRRRPSGSTVISEEGGSDDDGDTGSSSSPSTPWSPPPPPSLPGTLPPNPFTTDSQPPRLPNPSDTISPNIKKPLSAPSSENIIREATEEEKQRYGSQGAAASSRFGDDTLAPPPPPSNDDNNT